MAKKSKSRKQTKKSTQRSDPDGPEMGKPNKSGKKVIDQKLIFVTGGVVSSIIESLSLIRFSSLCWMKTSLFTFALGFHFAISFFGGFTQPPFFQSLCQLQTTPTGENSSLQTHPGKSSGLLSTNGPGL